MKMRKSLGNATVAAQASHAIDPASGAVVPPIHPATTFARDKNYKLTQEKIQYSRDDNPTFAHAEKVIAQLEGGSEALLFSSGMAGVATIFRTLNEKDHIVAPSKMYFGVVHWLKHFACKSKMGLTFYDPAKPESLERAIQKNKTKIVWVETPANPTWEITDIRVAAELAHDAGAALAVDNTVSTPVFTRPLDLGADFVFHSASKYLNGHSDVVAGVLVTKDQNEIWEAVKWERHNAGSILGPFEAWLLLRGLRTLFVRVHHSAKSALQIAKHFEKHPKLERLLYPGLEAHPAHDIAKRQMTGGFSGMLSILVNGGAKSALEVAKHAEVFIPATSLGGVESLLEHRKSVEGPESQVPENLLRLSIGLEDVNDLIADLEQALERVTVS
ncbi:PLP-dependent transferase [Candidatus Acetothermia bacterium]|nr:PLP-dependent transferase [Candidatus Acetothermia bacterium]MBI3643774.1 PLP-dependent transferase [Candidatus Acetothermia bacterium]